MKVVSIDGRIDDEIALEHQRLEKVAEYREILEELDAELDVLKRQRERYFEEYLQLLKK